MLENARALAEAAERHDARTQLMRPVSADLQRVEEAELNSEASDEDDPTVVEVDRAASTVITAAADVRLSTVITAAADVRLSAAGEAPRLEYDPAVDGPDADLSLMTDVAGRAVGERFRRLEER